MTGAATQALFGIGRRVVWVSNRSRKLFVAGHSTMVPRDVQIFQDGYPGQEDDISLSANLKFYLNEGTCKPNNLLIDDLHSRWKGDYDTLEFEHGFIQWLFPIPEHGMNYRSQPLQKHEAEAMRASPDVQRRVIASYRLMLDFYGMKLADETTGLLERATLPTDYASRYRNLVRSSHNYLRISRILKHLSIMGQEHLNLGFLLHVLNEQSEKNELISSSLCRSMDNWWANCLRNGDDRTWVGSKIAAVRNGELTFSRDMYIDAIRRRMTSGKFE